MHARYEHDSISALQEGVMHHAHVRAVHGAADAGGSAGGSRHTGFGECAAAL